VIEVVVSWHLSPFTDDADKILVIGTIPEVPHVPDLIRNSIDVGPSKRCLGCSNESGPSRSLVSEVIEAENSIRYRIASLGD